MSGKTSKHATNTRNVKNTRSTKNVKNTKSTKNNKNTRSAGKRKVKLKKDSLLGKIILVVILLYIVLTIFRYAGYFKRENDGDLKVIIQGENNLEFAHSVYIDENNIVYFSEEDMKTYFDKKLYYEKTQDNKKRYCSICQNKILEIVEEEPYMYINGIRNKIRGQVFEKDNVTYFPISEFKDVYNIEINYLADENRLNIDKLSEKKVTAIIKKDTKLKYKMTNISRTIDELELGDQVVVVEEMNKKWVKIETEDYQVGYVKKSKLMNFQNDREKLELEEQYFQTFDINKDLVVEVDQSIYEEFESKLANYEARKELCSNISNMAIMSIAENDLSEKNIGVKIDVSNIQDKDNYYRFLQELKVLLNSNGCFLIVVNHDGLDKTELTKVSNLVI